MRFLTTALCLAALALPLYAADDKPADGEKPTPKEQFSKLQKEIMKKRSELITKVRAAEGQDQQAMYSKGMGEIGTEFQPKLVALAKEHKADPVAGDALMMALQFSPPNGKEANEVVALLGTKEFAATLTKNVQRFAGMGESGEKLIRQALIASDDKGKPAVKLALAGNLAGQAEDAKETVAKLKSAEAEKLYDEIAASDDEKSAKQAKDALYEIRNLAVGKPLPEIEGKTLDDKAVKVSDLKGKVVVLDVWATWCPPCRAMIPHERELVERMKEKPFALVSVSCDQEKDKLTEFLKENEMPWTHWWDGSGGSVGKALRIKHYPTIYVLDAKGTIRYKEVRGPDMDKAVDTLLKELETK